MRFQGTILTAALLYFSALAEPVVAQDISRELRRQCSRIIPGSSQFAAREAVTACTEILQVENLPSHLRSDALEERSKAYIVLGDQGRALADLDELIRSARDPWSRQNAYRIMGAFHAGRGDHGRAISNFSEAIRVDPSNATAHVERGMSYAARGEHSRAISDFSTAIRLSPTYAPAYRGRAEVHDRLGNAAQAAADRAEAERANRRTNECSPGSVNC